MVIPDPPVIDSHFINFNFYFPYPELFFLSNSTIARRGSLNKMVCGEHAVDRFRVRRLLTVGVFRCNCNCCTQLLSIFLFAVFQQVQGLTTPGCDLRVSLAASSSRSSLSLPASPWRQVSILTKETVLQCVIRGRLRRAINTR